MLHYYNTNNNIDENQYISLAILNENKMMDNYIDNINDEVDLGQNITWYMYIHNNLLHTSNIKIRVKLQNATGSSPDSEKMRPSESIVIFEEDFILNHNQTKLSKMNWVIRDIKRLDNSTHITKLSINGEEIYTDVYSDDYSPFRMIFELWTYSSFYDTYIFGYEIEKMSYAPWAQIWFYINLTS